MKEDIKDEIINRKKTVLQNINTIIKKNEKQKVEKILPKFNYIKEASNIILKYIKDNKRKIYGGLAINEAIKRKDKSMAIYDDEVIPDYDFYSPEPIKDIILICQLLHEKGYKHIQCKEAFHSNTYKIKIERYEKELADVSYVWIPYYNIIPTFVVNDIHYVRPDYQIIDLYRAFTNPLFGWLKIEKYYERASILENMYLLDSKISEYKKNFDVITYDKKNKEQNTIIKILENIEKNFLKNNENIIIVGDYAYNKLMNISKVDNHKERNIDAINFEVISTNIDKTNKELMKFFNKNNISENIEKTCIYPFLELYDKSYLYTYNSIPLIRLYYTDICFPYNTIRNYNLGSYHLIMQFLNAKKFRNIVIKNLNLYYKYKYMVENLSYAREYYYYKNNKTGIEETPFQELIVNCLGSKFVSLFQQYAEKVKKGKLFNYTPKDIFDIDKITKNYVYPNRSGNPENIPKNINIKKLMKYYPEFIKEKNIKKINEENMETYKKVNL